MDCGLLSSSIKRKDSAFADACAPNRQKARDLLKETLNQQAGAHLPALVSN